MFKPPYLAPNSKRTQPQYLTPRVRPTTTYCYNKDYVDLNHYDRSREKEHNTYANTSISYKHSERPKSRPSNPLEDLKIRLTSLKEQVTQIISNEEEESREISPFRKEGVLSHRSSSVDDFNPGLSLEIQRKPSHQGNQRKILERENYVLKGELMSLKNKYSARKAQSDQQILSLNRKLIASELAVEQNETKMQIYKREIQLQMESIRTTLQDRNAVSFHHEQYYHALEQNSILKRRLEDLSTYLQEKEITISILEQRLEMNRSDNSEAKLNKIVQLSKLSEMRAESNIFDLSRSKINIEQEKETLSTNLKQIESCLRSEKQQVKLLKESLEVLENTVTTERVLKKEMEKQINTMRSQLHQKVAELKFLNDQIALLTKSTQDLLKRNKSLQQQIEELKAEPAQSIINMITSEIYVQGGSTQSEDDNQKHIHQARISALQQQIRELRNEMKNPFGQLFQKKQETGTPLKAVIESKDEQIEALSSKVSFIRCELKNTKSQLQIERLKSIAQKKQLTVSFEVSVGSLKSELQIFKKSSDSLSYKSKILLEDNRKKDEFIQKWILGKANTAPQKLTVEQFISKFREEFSHTE